MTKPCGAEALPTIGTPSDERLLHTYGADRIVRTLAEFVTTRRRERIEEVLAQRIHGVCVAIEAPAHPHNAAAVVRTAEALGLLDVHVIAAEGAALRAKVPTRGAYRWIRTHHHAAFDAFSQAMRAGAFQLAGATTRAAKTLEELPVGQGRLCLLFGNEHRGLSPAALATCTHTFRIPLVGMSECLNLSVAAGIALHATVRRRRQVTKSDLDESERLTLRARYYLGSVDPRLVQGLFPQP